MTWTWIQDKGSMLGPNGRLLERGYAGKGAGVNNPAMQFVKKVGPLPKGWYTIGPAYKHPVLGRICMNLEPDAGNDMQGRALFRIHGDNSKGDRSASEGCIILGPDARNVINLSRDKRLQVV